MTEYDHWPPIRFRFFGDEDQARGRIPQARSLMAQLIRRMEGQERDNGQWQVQAEDGTQFRVTKMGDVHVADIVGVSPSVERQRPMRDITPAAPEFAQRELLMRPHGEAFKEGNGDYLWVGARVLLPDFDPETHPHYIAATGPVTFVRQYDAAPQIPFVWPPDYPLILENGFEYDGTGFAGDNLHIQYPGKRDQINDDTDKTYVAIKPLANLVIFEPTFNESSGHILQTLNAYDQHYDEVAWEGREIAYKAEFQYVSYDFDIKFLYAYDFTKWAFSPSKLVDGGYAWADGIGDLGINLNFDYGVTDGRTLVGNNYKKKLRDENGSLIGEELIKIGLLNVWEWDLNIPQVRPSKFQVNSFDYGSSIVFENIFLKNQSGLYTTAPGVSKKDTIIDVHAYIALDPNDQAKQRQDFQPPASINPVEITPLVDFDTALKGGKSNNVFYKTPTGPGELLNSSVIKSPVFETGTGETFDIPYVDKFTREPVGVAKFERVADFGQTEEAEASWRLIYADEIVGEGEASVLQDEVVRVNGEIKDGLYELRMSAGWHDLVDSKNPGYWSNAVVECEVYIQIGSKLTTYNISLSMADYSAREGVFDVAQWNNSQTPTLFDDKWYPGCWLIDIKNKTIIHETDPAKLDRPWFTQ